MYHLIFKPIQWTDDRFTTAYFLYGGTTTTSNLNTKPLEMLGLSKPASLKREMAQFYLNSAMEKLTLVIIWS